MHAPNSLGLSCVMCGEWGEPWPCEAETMREALADMVNQFAYWSEGETPGQVTGGLSALEGAFAALGYDEPHIAEHLRCDEPGCRRANSSGWPSPTGYRHTCHEHSDFHVNRRCNWPDDSPHWLSA